MDNTKYVDLINALRSDAQKNTFRMEWEGDKTPIGATINGAKIGLLKNGMIIGEGDGSLQLGTYTRAVEFGGGSERTHIIFISTDYEDVTPPPCGKVEKLIIEKGGRKDGAGG